MKSKLLLLTYIFISFSTFSQNFGSFASGIKINNTLYNTSFSAAIHQINSSPGALNFDGSNLGSFGQNSVNNLITASEIKTFKTVFGNVCSGTLNWRVYPVGMPSGTYNAIALNTVTDCNIGTSVFNDNLGPCGNGDQKWKDYSLNTNFIHLLGAGNYTLEIFYSYTGSNVNNNTCEETKFINNGGANFKANFTIYSPSSSPTALPNPICEGNTLNLTANPTGGIAPFTFVWTGPNGFTSTLQNPTIPNVVLANAGVYSLITTDSLGAISPSENTSSVVVTPRLVPTFETLILSYCRKVTPSIPPILPLLPAILPVQLPNTSTEGIDGAWSLSSTNDNPTALPLFINTDPPYVGPNPPLSVITTYYFYPNASECGQNTSVNIEIRRNTTPTFGFPLVYCVGDVVPNLPLNSTNSVGGTWSNVLGAPITKINTSVIGLQQINFTPNSGLCALQVAIFVNIKPKLTPTFNLPSFVCVNGAVPILPLQSTNVPPIVGTWSPNVVSNTTSQTYNFTATAALGVCSLPFSIAINVNPIRTPDFAPINSFCAGATAPILSGTSPNGISGTWNPAVISNTTSGSYVFTPTITCDNPQTLNVVIIPNRTPDFAQLNSFCTGASVPILSGTSPNGISGTWTPAVISNTTSGSYVFTPTTTCDNTQTLNVVIEPIRTPDFAQINSFCAGATAPILAGTSPNGISGTWTPPVISNSTNGSYVFTPTTTCDNLQTLNVVIIPNRTPDFAQINSFCAGATAPILSGTSPNGISGTWTPAVISNTTSGSYVFTPTTTCDNTQILNVVVAPVRTPDFAPINSFCAGATAPILSGTSPNGISGTWTPTVISNTTSGSYIFTPTTTCDNSQTLNVVVAPVRTPDFAQITNVCIGLVAPILSGTSPNGISGTWTPAVISNTTSGSYTFTPTTTCDNSQTLNILVAPVRTPDFAEINSFCEGATAQILSGTSPNGISGTWAPSVISNTTSGTYVFTPTITCDKTQTLNVILIQKSLPTFSIPLSICYNSLAPTLPLISENAISGTWSPSIVNQTGTGTYTFTPTLGICAKEKTITITYVPEILSEIKSECINTNYTLTVNPIGNSFNLNNTYIWKDKLGNIITGSTTPSFNVTQYIESTTLNESVPLTYSVEITTPEGCKSSQTFIITDLYCQIQKGISPNGDGKNEFFDLNNFDVKVFSIFNRYGVKVYVKSGYKNEWTGQTDSGEILPDGTYFYNIEFGNNEIKTGWVYINKETK